jgi:sarcosine oxidase subunit gamma
LADSASAEYLWGCLADAMDEFGGTPVGLSALRQLAGGG